MGVRDDYRHTFNACYITYVIQAALVTLAPLLFVTFSEEFSLGLDEITLLTTLNFGIQLVFDIISTKVIDRVGFRSAMIVSHILVSTGLVTMAFAPYVLDSPYMGLVLGTLVYGAGGGISEVVVNPIVVSCPVEDRSKALTILHSFFCWGQAIVVVLCTLFFVLFGTAQWSVMLCLWAVLPIANTAYVSLVPMADGKVSGNDGNRINGLLKLKVFWLFVVLMLCGGAAEHAMGQWASAFAEETLGISKTAGDLVGLGLFAVFMAVARTIYGKSGEGTDLYRYMLLSTLMCIVCLAVAAFSPYPWLALAGCALCGFATGIYWPGTLGMSSTAIPMGGTAMFALLSLAGDVGCSTGPTVVGFAADLGGGSLAFGLATAIVFPLIMVACLVVSHREGIL
ncbi:MAG: MFS transporter [archaeon]|nr:MFS transporter [archaeon]